jgi:tRNA U34 5-carboxymethylaminomethyl modifying enzyme MnmG/GidA
VGETLEVIHEDGTKTPAPDGEHLLELRDESDEINRIKLFTEGGIIKERENVEIEAESEEKKEEEMADVSTEEVKALPETGKSDTDVNEQITLESEPGIAVDEEVVDKEADIVNLTTKLEEQEEKIEEMKERIEELVKYFEDIKKEEEALEEEKKEEEELESKKLDGAPTEKPAMFNKKKNNNFKVGNYRNSVLSKMYR